MLKFFGELEEQVTVDWRYETQLGDHVDLVDLCQNSPPVEKTHLPNAIDITVVDVDGCPLQTVPLFAGFNFFFCPDKNIDLKIFFDEIRLVSAGSLLCNSPDSRKDVYVHVAIRKWIDEDKCKIHNLYFKAKDAKDAREILNFMQYHMHTLDYRRKQRDPFSFPEQYTVPLWIGRYELTKYRKLDDRTGPVDRIIIVDKECVSFYSRKFQKTPTECFYFWREFMRDTAIKISHRKKANIILFQSPKIDFILSGEGKNSKTLKHFKDLDFQVRNYIQPYPQIAFTSRRGLCEWIMNNDMETTEDRATKIKVYKPVLGDLAIQRELERCSEEITKKKAAEKKQKEEEEKQKQEADEKQKQGAEEKQKQGAEEKQKQGAEEKQKQEADEKQKQEADEKQKETEEKQKEEPEEKQEASAEEHPAAASNSNQI